MFVSSASPLFPCHRHLNSSLIFSQFLTLVRYLIHPCPRSSRRPAPVVTFSSVPFPARALQSSNPMCIQSMNTLKHSDRKHWDAYCSADKDTQLNPITSFFKQKTPGKHDFASFNSTFVDQPCNDCVQAFVCVCVSDEIESCNWGFSKWADCCSDCATHKGRMDEMRYWGDKGKIRRVRGGGLGGRDERTRADCCTFVMCKKPDKEKRDFFCMQ